MIDIIALKKITKKYQTGEEETSALRGIDLTLKKGDFVAIMGPSGSGKSTLMHILGLLDRPSNGSYLLGGEDVSKLGKTKQAAIRNKQIGFVFQQFNLLPRTTVLDNVVLPTIYSKVKETEKRAQEIIKALALVDKEFKNWKYVCKVWESDCSRGHIKEEMELIKQLGLDNKKIIHLGGSYSREFMPYFLNIADIYAAPSRLEGFGMIQVEAQTCGVPVISIDTMGPKETILHGETGFLARVEKTIDLESELTLLDVNSQRRTRIFFDKPKTLAYRANVDDLKNYLLTLLTDDKKRQMMGQRAREHAVEKFHYLKIASEISDLIKKRLLKAEPAS